MTSAESAAKTAQGPAPERADAVRPGQNGQEVPAPALVRSPQDFSANFWNVWQVAGTWLRLPAKVHVTSLT